MYTCIHDCIIKLCHGYILNCIFQAIENGKLLAELKAAVQSMQQESRVPREHYLDVCVKVPGVDKDNLYDRHPMTLLAFAGYHARKDMLDFLIDEGARKCTS